MDFLALGFHMSSASAIFAFITLMEHVTEEDDVIISTLRKDVKNSIASYAVPDHIMVTDLMTNSLSTHYYTLSHRECRHPRHFCHANFAKFEMISTTTGSWIRPALKALSGAVDSNCPSSSKSSRSLQSCRTKVTRVSTLSTGQRKVFVHYFASVGDFGTSKNSIW